MRLTLQSHNFLIDELSPFEHRVVREYLHKFVEYNIFKRRGKVVREPLRTYAAATKDRSQYRLHINSLDSFIEHCGGSGIGKDKMTIVKRKVKRNKIVKVEFKVKNLPTPRDYQVGPIEFAKDPEGNNKLLSLQTGQGKSQPLDEPVLTPTGFRPIGELVVGDLVVCPDGSTVPVTGVYPQGLRPRWRVTTVDGRITYCDRDHWWTVRIGDAWHTLTTRDLEPYLTAQTLVTIPLLQVPTTAHRPISEPVFSPGGRMSHFTSTQEEALAIQMHYWSMGKVCYVKYLGGDDPMWRVTVDRLTELPIIDVVPDQLDHMVCISIDHPAQLYITRDYIVTHNTFCAIKAMVDMGVKTEMVMRAGFIPQWMENLGEYLELEDNDLLYPSDTEGFIKVMEQALKDPSSQKIIIMSNSIKHKYFKYMEDTNHRGKKYPIKPDDYYEKMGIGLVIRDEVHMEFHGVFRQHLYSHVDNAVGLSATLVSKSPLIKYVMETMHPLNQRNSGAAMVKYIVGKAYMYQMHSAANLPHMGAMGYSHGLLEEHILKRKRLAEMYFDMIDGIFVKEYVMRRKVYGNEDTDKNHKCMVYFARVEMCLAFRDYLRDRYDDLEIEKYTSEDPDHNLYNPDVVITTLGSAGTGKDVKGLITVIVTQAIDSPTATMQSTGRLREIRDGSGVEPVLAYLVCKDIDRQMVYHRGKDEWLADKTKSLEEVHIDGFIDQKLIKKPAGSL